MATTTSRSTHTPRFHVHNDVAAFNETLLRSRRILILCGAGLSAASGLPTFRGPGGYWRNYQATELATPKAFYREPHLVWLFYAYRRHMALNAKPNPAHYALAELGRKLGPDRMLCMSQNVDGLHLRAGHDPATLRLLHGSLMRVECVLYRLGRCGYVEEHNTDDPICPSLALAAQEATPEQIEKHGKGYVPMLDPDVKIPKIRRDDLPQCPECPRSGRGKQMLRPGVVWFGEQLPDGVLEGVDKWIDDSTYADEFHGKVDLMLVIGTSAIVYPAAGYVNIAEGAGATIAYVNMEAETREELTRLRRGIDFAFGGDAAVLVPKLLEPLIGKMVTGPDGQVRFEENTETAPKADTTTA